MERVWGMLGILLIIWIFTPSDPKPAVQAPDPAWCQKVLDKLVEEGEDPIEARKHGRLKHCSFGLGGTLG